MPSARQDCTFVEATIATTSDNQVHSPTKSIGPTFHYTECHYTPSDLTHNFYTFFAALLVVFPLIMLKVRREVKNSETEFDRRRREGWTPRKEARNSEREEMMGLVGGVGGGGIEMT